MAPEEVHALAAALAAANSHPDPSAFADAVLAAYVPPSVPAPNLNM